MTLGRSPFGAPLGGGLPQFEQVTADPSAAGLVRRTGTIVQRADGAAWVKTSASSTGWTSIPRLGGLQKLDQTTATGTVSTLAFTGVPTETFGGIILTAAIKNAQNVEVGLRLRFNGVHTSLSAASLFAGANNTAGGFTSANRGDLGAVGANGTTEIIIFLPFGASSLGFHRSALYYRTRLSAAGVAEYTYTGAIAYADAATAITGADIMSETLNAVAAGSTAALWGWRL